MRCADPCGKIQYHDKNMALLAAIKVTMKLGTTFTPYLAEDCGCWHISGHHRGRHRNSGVGKLGRQIGQFKLKPP
jgi:hypothetical protein